MHGLRTYAPHAAIRALYMTSVDGRRRSSMRSNTPSALSNWHDQSILHHQSHAAQPTLPCRAAMSKLQCVDDADMLTQSTTRTAASTSRHHGPRDRPAPQSQSYVAAAVLCLVEGVCVCVLCREQLSINQSINRTNSNGSEMKRDSRGVISTTPSSRSPRCCDMARTQRAWSTTSCRRRSMLARLEVLCPGNGMLTFSRPKQTHTSSVISS